MIKIEDLLFIPITLLIIFVIIIIIIIIPIPSLFTKSHGISHRLTGLLYLLWLLLGYTKAIFINIEIISIIVYDIILGILGIILTLTAANDFKHKGIKNIASGTLDEHATVTHDEMIEHSFYQGYY
jgi:hypothetical protein